MTENLKLWNKHRTPDPSMTRKVDMRGGFTCIDPQYQLQVATEEWGPYGSTWGMRSVMYKHIPDVGTMMLTASFWYPGGEFPIAVDMRFKPGDDCCKKLMTNARSKALSMLGFGADVYLGKFDDVGYITEAKIRTNPGGFKESAIKRIESCTSNSELSDLCRTFDDMLERETITKDMHDDLICIADTKYSEEFSLS